MKTRMKLLDCTIIGLLYAGVAVPASAQEAPAPMPPANAQTACDGDVCRSDEGLLFQVRTQGEGQQAAKGDSAQDLQANRRVDVTMEPASPGVARVTGRLSVNLPNGGVVWATEDPALSQPALTVQAGSFASFDQGEITKPVQFQGYTNYASFMQSMEVRIYRGDDSDLVTPLAIVEMPLAGVSRATWDGHLPAGLNLRPGDTLRYVTRAYAADGSFDETLAQQIQLVTPEEFERGVRQVRDQAQQSLGLSLDSAQAQALTLQNATFGQNVLRQQNIRIYGSRVRIHGRDIPRNGTVRINGADFPVDQQGKFVAEFLEPVGQHDYELELKLADGETVSKTLAVDVSGAYSFIVAMADFTLSRNSVSGNVSPTIGAANSTTDLLSEGRLAFYSKTKFNGKYLVTAQADTRDRDVKELFNGFLKADRNPRDVFRQLDPDLYYPTYGDDSTTYRDVDTQGRLYLRMDWDQNQALWGNYSTGPGRLPATRITSVPCMARRLDGAATARRNWAIR